jgi:hypothetical protein
LASPRPLEIELLAPVEKSLTAGLTRLGTSNHSARLDILEAVACHLSGLGLNDLREGDGFDHELTVSDAECVASEITELIHQSQVPPTLALTSLAREQLTQAERRKAGSYYTDFRLAMYLARRSTQKLRDRSKIIDPASGTGTLLAATVLALAGDDADTRTNIVAEAICAGDLSGSALRGVRLSLTSLVNNIAAIKQLQRRLRTGDSLTSGAAAWYDVAPGGFDLVIGNPPWEKLKLTRHEHLAASGKDRHYGDDYDQDAPPAQEFADARAALAKYVGSLTFDLQGSREPDLYKLFLALACELVRPNGYIGLLVPAGLIRSDGTKPLRQYLVENALELDVAILDNKAKFFSIDTRFKFLAVTARLGAAGAHAPLTLEHAEGTASGVDTTGRVSMDRSDLAKIRPDLSVPEVRSEDEWALFHRLSQNGLLLGDADSPWKMKIVREVDMTRDRKLFSREQGPDDIPLVEGRMVHQYRHAAKAYVSGTGRRAQWGNLMPGEEHLSPQFWIDPRDLSEPILARTTIPRLGFCDITGQTNERAMLAAWIPAGLACGNKVPTITFDKAEYDAEYLARVWLAVANSFAFDWLLRRVVTTTVNYFVLLSVPFPRLDPDGETAAALAQLVEEVEDAHEDPLANLVELGSLRAQIDAHVFRAYGISPSSAELIFDDFPLLDRGQPSLPGDARPTVTRDMVMLELYRLVGEPSDQFERRVREAVESGAVGFLPSQLARRKHGSDMSLVA